jgi:DNA-binding CsgD family transcriptional regulator
MVHAMFSPGAVSEFLRHHTESSPWVRVLRAVETGVPFASEDHVPVATIRHTAFYKSLMKPYGIGGCFGTKLWDRVDGRAVFIVTCAEDQLATMRSRALPVLERLAPHLHRSLSLCWAIRRERAKGLEDGLARQADAVFVLNERREVVFRNAAASKLLEDGVVRLLAATQRLRLGSRKDNAALDSLFELLTLPKTRAIAPTRHQQTLIRSPPALTRSIMTFSAPGRSGPNLLEVLTLPGAEASVIESIFQDRLREPHYLVTVRLRDSLSVPAFEDVRKVFGLSQKETQVALALVEGQSIEDFAASRGVSVDTVRWHLKNIYRRTGCKSQADLVRLVLSLVCRARFG